MPLTASRSRPFGSGHSPTSRCPAPFSPRPTPWGLRGGRKGSRGPGAPRWLSSQPPSTHYALSLRHALGLCRKQQHPLPGMALREPSTRSLLAGAARSQREPSGMQTQPGSPCRLHAPQKQGHFHCPAHNSLLPGRAQREARSPGLPRTRPRMLQEAAGLGLSGLRTSPSRRSRRGTRRSLMSP